MVGSPATTRMLRVFANCSSAELGSVMAMNWLPSPPAFFQKYSKCESVSSVPPDFDETMNIVLPRSRVCSACRIIAGCVVSRTCNCFAPNVRFNTSGAREEPPMPSRTNVSNLVRASVANSTTSPARSCMRFGSSSQPSHLSSSVPVQTVASRAQIRSMSSCCVATVTPPSRLDELAALRADAVQQLLEGIGELLHALALQRGGDVVVVDASGSEIGEQLVRCVDVLRERQLDLAVILEGADRLLGHGVHRLRADQLLDIQDVAILGILRRRGRPQAALFCGALRLEGLPAWAGEHVEIVLVRELRVGDRELAIQLRGLATDLVEPPVGLGVHAGDEEARDRVHLAR